MLPFCQETEKRPFSPFSKTWHLGSKITVSANKAAHPALRIPSSGPASRTPITTPQAVLRLVQSPPPPKGVHPVSHQGRAPAGLLSHSPALRLTRRPPLSLPGPSQAHPHSYSPRPPKGNIVTVTKWRDHTCYFRSSWHLGSTHRPSPSVSHTSPVALRPLPRRQNEKKSAKCFGRVIDLNSATL